MTEADITAAAEADVDNPPLSDIELSKVRSARVVRQARLHPGLSQAAFAKTYSTMWLGLEIWNKGALKPTARFWLISR
jgi:DNA-binding transcriptional regulator YiaG